MQKLSLTLILALAGIGLAGQTFAHALLKSATPSANGTVSAAPTELDLKFSEDLNLKFSGVKVTGPKQEAVQTGEGMLMDNNTTLMVPVSGTLAPGIYTVEWHALSGDGHKTHGSYKFTIKP
jgi:copper resistance protein C